MKTIKFTISVYWLLLLSIANAQQSDICTDFNNGTYDGWQNFNTHFLILNSNPIDNSSFLRIRDAAYDSYGYNSVSYPNNWNELINSCLCFDYKIIFDGNLGITRNLSPKITIYNGSSPSSSSIVATFVVSTTVTENDPWVHICAPIKLSNGYSLPVNANGTWTGVTPAEWHTLLSNVGGIAFYTDFGWAPMMEIIGVDNICITDCGMLPSFDQGTFCCDGENLITNGNFEAGNTGFTSQYASNPTTYPGEYYVSNSALAFGAIVADHSYCANPTLNALNGDYMLINGKTQQPSDAYIWEQTISGLEMNSNYKFCVNFKNIPQNSFDILPKVSLSVAFGSIGSSTLFSTIQENTLDPCDWVEEEFVFNTGLNTFVNLGIILDETGNGDGNDLVIDDISLTKLLEGEYDISVTNSGGSQNVTATILAMYAPDCEYDWFVAEVTSYSPIQIDFNTLASGNANGNSMSSNPWNFSSTDFSPYVFNDNTLYIVGIYSPICGCFDETFTYQLTYNNSFVGVEMLTEEEKQQIIDWIENGGDSNDELLNATDQLNDGSNNLLIYPNPVEDSFNISMKGSSLKSVEVLTITGQIIFSNTYTDGKAEEILDISRLASGVYLVTAYGMDEQRYTTKIVKE